MPGVDILPVFPSRANLVLMKTRHASAVKGLGLLKRKQDALERKLRELRAQLKEYQDKIIMLLQEAYISLAMAKYHDTDLKLLPVSCQSTADVYVQITNTSVVGLPLPKFDLVVDQPQCFPYTGLAKGGRKVDEVRSSFQEAAVALASSGSLEYSAKLLHDGVRQNSMRMNGLEFVVIPRIARTIKYIQDELEEFEREEFFRLKRSRAKQREVKQAFAKVIVNLHETTKHRPLEVFDINAFDDQKLQTNSKEKDRKAQESEETEERKETEAKAAIQETEKTVENEETNHKERKEIEERQNIEETDEIVENELTKETAENQADEKTEDTVEAMQTEEKPEIAEAQETEENEER